jgi:beta-galactosidase GanA
MIEAEEEKRKAVVEGQLIGAHIRSLADIPASQQGTEEDFSWDDEVEQDPVPGAAVTAPAVSTTDLPVPTSTADATTPKAGASEKIPSQPAVAGPSKIATSTSSTSPRDSEESYDLVSDQKKSAAPTDDDDSDWE